MVRLSRLPVPLIPERWRVNALAVSPDGTRLAVALEPGGAERPRLQLYSMTSGALLREWGVNTGRPGTAPVIGFMSWAADGRTLEYSYPVRGNGAALLDVGGVVLHPLGFQLKLGLHLLRGDSSTQRDRSHVAVARLFLRVNSHVVAINVSGRGSGPGHGAKL